jgi:hypothetical protein
MYSPDAVGRTSLDVRCGQLNLVDVTEPLKVSRLLLGIDDEDLHAVKNPPRIPQVGKASKRMTGQSERAAASSGRTFRSS